MHYILSPGIQVMPAAANHISDPKAMKNSVDMEVFNNEVGNSAGVSV